MSDSWWQIDFKHLQTILSAKENTTNGLGAVLESSFSLAPQSSQLELRVVAGNQAQWC